MASAIKRLHDIGYGAVWVVIGFGAKCMFALCMVVGVLAFMGQSALETGSMTYWWIIALTMLPAIAGTLWLHVHRGQARFNRFGAVPGPSGFSNHPAASIWSSIGAKAA